MRKPYKFLHWDYGTNRGIATDGARYNGQFIEFEVRGQDLSPEHDNHLIMDEVFLAEEDSAGGHHLYDIVIEQGARAILTPLTRPPVQAIDDEQAAFIVSQNDSNDQDEVYNI